MVSPLQYILQCTLLRKVSDTCYFNNGLEPANTPYSINATMAFQHSATMMNSIPSYVPRFEVQCHSLTISYRNDPTPPYPFHMMTNPPNFFMTHQAPNQIPNFQMAPSFDPIAMDNNTASSMGFSETKSFWKTEQR
jgi:hypothetical protein